MTIPQRKDRLRARLNRKGENLSLAQFHRLRVAIDDARTNDALDHVDAMIENAIHKFRWPLALTQPNEVSQ